MMMPPQPLLAFRRTANVMCRSVSMGAQVSSPWCLFVLLDFRPYVTPEGFEPSRHELDSSWHSSAYYTGTPDATRARFDRPPIQQCHFDNTIAQRNSTCTPLRHSVDNIFVNQTFVRSMGKDDTRFLNYNCFFPSDLRYGATKLLRQASAVFSTSPVTCHISFSNIPTACSTFTLLKTSQTST